MPSDPAPSEQSDFAQRLGFLELSASDQARLRALTPLFRQRFDAFVERFYGHLFAYPDTARLLGDAEQLERLKRMQMSHFESLLEADWGEDYVERRRRVGQAHADVGVEPHLFVGAYNQYLQHCLNCYAEYNGLDPASETNWLPSLVKSVLLDISLTLDAYFTQMTNNLREALDMLWKANNDLRQFAQMTTHDLKTPLATVANLCEEAIDEFGAKMPDEARDLVAAARAGAFRMSAMIDELLMSTLASESDAVADVDAGEVFRDAIDRVAPVIKQRGIELALPQRWPRIHCNRVRLREAFYNILSNAAKFIERKRGRIEVTAETCGRLARFCIADNGPGIPENEHARIFVPFRRLPMHRKRPGSGLGLYFAKNLVEEQGGRIWVESESDQGSRFYIEIPMAGATGHAPQSAE